MENQIVKHGNITLEIEFVRREDADKATVARVDACEEEFRKMLLDRYYDDRAGTAQRRFTHNQQPKGNGK